MQMKCCRAEITSVTKWNSSLVISETSYSYVENENTQLVGVVLCSSIWHLICFHLTSHLLISSENGQIPKLKSVNLKNHKLQFCNFFNMRFIDFFPMVVSQKQWRSQLFLTWVEQMGGEDIFQGDKTLKQSSVLTTLNKKVPVFLDFTQSYGACWRAKIFYRGQFPPKHPLRHCSIAQ